MVLYSHDVCNCVSADGTMMLVGKSSLSSMYESCLKMVVDCMFYCMLYNAHFHKIVCKIIE